MVDTFSGSEQILLFLLPMLGQEEKLNGEYLRKEGRADDLKKNVANKKAIY